MAVQQQMFVIGGAPELPSLTLAGRSWVQRTGGYNFYTSGTTGGVFDLGPPSPNRWIVVCGVFYYPGTCSIDSLRVTDYDLETQLGPCSIEANTGNQWNTAIGYLHIPEGRNMYISLRHTPSPVTDPLYGVSVYRLISYAADPFDAAIGGNYGSVTTLTTSTLGKGIIINSLAQSTGTVLVAPSMTEIFTDYITTNKYFRNWYIESAPSATEVTVDSTSSIASISHCISTWKYE